MNDRQDPYGQIYGYDEYGRPLYGVPPQQPPTPEGYQGHQGYQGYQGYDYGAAQPQAEPEARPQEPPQPGYEAYGGQPGYGYGTAEQPAVPPAPAAPPERDPSALPEDYGTEQFSFVDEQNEESQDVIDWLKFSESRTERREEAKRRGRGRRRLLIVALALVLLGGTALAWSSGSLPFLSDSEEEGAAADDAEGRDVIVVHLRQTDSEQTATALLVANDAEGTGATLLLPNDLALAPDGGTTTLGQAVTEEAAGSVRDAIGGLLGADIKGTWRLDTPYLEVLVDRVGGIVVSTDTEVAGEGEGEEPLVTEGEDIPLDGRAAVAYATHRGADEPAGAQLARFGQVMQAVLAKLPSEEDGARRVVAALGQIADPSLTEDALGASLARLAGYAQDGAYATSALPVESGGTLSDETAETVVAEVLGGTVSEADPGAAAGIAIRDATGEEGTAEAATITLVNGGFTVVDSRVAEEASETSRVTYAAEAHEETALEVARTLGLPEEAVTLSDGAAGVDVTIILGGDYEK